MTQARIRAAALAALALGTLSACSSRVEIENDRLREENQSLKQQVETLTGANAELNAKLSEATSAHAAPMQADVLAALPRVASIDVDNLSGYYPGDRAQPATSVRIFLRPFDGRRRFVQAVGNVAVEALIIPNGVGAADGTEASNLPPRAQLVANLTPTQLREAYRSGITGTHYEIDLMLAAPMPDRSATILVRAQFTDAVTGVVHKAERLIKPSTPATKSTAARESASK